MYSETDINKFKPLAEAIICLRESSRESRQAADLWHAFDVSLKEGDVDDILTTIIDVYWWIDPAQLDV